MYRRYISDKGTEAEARVEATITRVMDRVREIDRVSPFARLVSSYLRLAYAVYLSCEDDSIRKIKTISLKEPNCPLGEANAVLSNLGCFYILKIKNSIDYLLARLARKATLHLVLTSAVLKDYKFAASIMGRRNLMKFGKRE